MSKITIDREPERVKVEKELGFFRIWFSILSFLLCAVAFAIGFPALADAGHKIGLGNLALGLPFAIDLGMVTLLLWSMWNRGALKRWWPPMIPAGALLALSSYLQYIHAVTVIPEELPAFARGGLLVLAAALPLLLALSAGVFEAVTFAPLIDRARRHTELTLEQQAADDKLWRVESESRQERAALEAEATRERMRVETEAQLELMAAEAEAAAKAIRGTSKSSSRRTAQRKNASPVKNNAPSSANESPAPEAAREKNEKRAEVSESQTEKTTDPLPVETQENEEVLSTDVEITSMAEEEPKNDAVASPAPPESEESLVKEEMSIPEDDENLLAAIEAVRSGELSQRKAVETYNVSRARLRRYL